MLLVALASVAYAQMPLEIGTRWELFVDDALIERTEGASLRLATPARREVALVTDQPWEGPSSAYFTVLQDGAVIRIYYRGHTPDDLSQQQVTCVAESVDGIQFTRPRVGLFEFQGSRDNNIIWRGMEAHNFAPMLDTNPACPPGERYKALGGVDGKLFAFCSEDGLRWRKLREEPVMTKGAFDSLNTAFWDESASVYRCYSRMFVDGVRSIQTSTSRDFITWSDPVPLEYTNRPPAEHLYTNAVRPCPGAPHILLGFPMRFVPERTRMPNYQEPGVSDALFMASRDGRQWYRWREAWVRPGPDEHNWTQRSNMPATGIVELGTEWSLYITEHYEWPTHRLRRLTTPRMRLASISSGQAGGTVSTRLLVPGGANLRLNYATSAAGSIRVEAQDMQGRTIAESLPIYGDDLDREIAWRDGKAPAANTPVRLVFHLHDADVFAFRFAP